MVTMKKCKCCNKIKDFSDYYKTNQYYQAICKMCKYEYDKEIRQKNKEKISVRNKERWNNLTLKQREDINLKRKYIKVICSSCNIEFNKRADSLKDWGGKCNKCATKEVANRPEIKKILIHNGLEYIKKYGKIPSPKLENRRRGENHHMWGVSIKGDKSPNWKGGISLKNENIRTSLEYSRWRKQVFRRDKYTCIICGDNKGGNLNADHIKPFSLFPELRLELDNGRTLCKECHHKYGAKVNYKKEIIQDATLFPIWISH